MIQKIKWHFQNWYGIYLIVLVALALLGCQMWYEYLYPCVSGHYEDTMHPIYDGQGNITTWYWSNDFYCDCRTVRDSIK